MEKKLTENLTEEEKQQIKEQFRRNLFMKKITEMCLEIKDPKQMEMVIEFMGIFVRKR